MSRRLTLWLTITCVTLSLAPTTVAAQSDDPMPGFGFLIAMGAILVAITIARRKRQHYQSESS